MYLEEKQRSTRKEMKKSKDEWSPRYVAVVYWVVVVSKCTVKRTECKLVKVIAAVNLYGRFTTNIQDV